MLQPVRSAELVLLFYKIIFKYFNVAVNIFTFLHSDFLIALVLQFN